MKKFFLPLLLCLFALATQAQEINNIVAYSQLNVTRVIATTTSDQLYSYTTKDGWTTLKKGEVPAGKVKFMGSYQLTSGTKLMIAMQNESMWRLKDENWVELPKEGLPENYRIKSFRPFANHKASRSSGGAFVLLADSTLWTYSEEENWTALDKTALPNVEVVQISTSQKMKGLSKVPHFLALLANQGLYKRSEKEGKWVRIETRQLPKGSKIQTVDAYLKTPIGAAAEDRIIISLQDGSIWWTSEETVLWKRINTEQLPKGYEIAKTKVFQKNNTSRLLVLLKDNSLWWYVESEGFQAVDMEGFGAE